MYQGAGPPPGASFFGRTMTQARNFLTWLNFYIFSFRPATERARDTPVTIRPARFAFQYFSFFVCRFSHFGGGFLKSRKNEYKERMFYCQGENVTPGLGSYEGISGNIWMQVTAGGTGFDDRNPILGP